MVDGSAAGCCGKDCPSLVATVQMRRNTLFICVKLMFWPVVPPERLRRLLSANCGALLIDLAHQPKRACLSTPSFRVHLEAFAGGDDLRLRNGCEVQRDAVHNKMPVEFTYEKYWQRIRGSNPLSTLRDLAQFLPKPAQISALTANREMVTIAESRRITQFPSRRQGYPPSPRLRRDRRRGRPCPNLSENLALA